MKALSIWAIGITAFLTWTPLFLLHHRITWRDAIPGAVLATAGLFGLRILSSFKFADWLNCKRVLAFYSGQTEAELAIAAADRKMEVTTSGRSSARPRSRSRS